MTGEDPAAEVEQLRQRLGEVSEECEKWQARCLGAEAEVRALKRSIKCVQPANAGARPPELVQGLGGIDGGSQPSSTRATPKGLWNWEVGGDRLSPGGSSDAELRGSLQSEVLVAERLREEVEAQKKSLLELRAAPSGDSSLDADELRERLKHKSEVILQLQGDFVRDTTNLNRERRLVETKNALCQEELSEMTQRAKAFSEQVARLKKKASEHQGARDEATKLHSELEDVESKLASQSRERAQTMDEVVGLKSELSGWQSEAGAALQEREFLKEAMSNANSELNMAKERSMTRGNEYTLLEEFLACSRSEACEAVEQRERALSCLAESEVEKAGDSPAGNKNGKPSAEAIRGEDAWWQARQQKVVVGVGAVKQLFAELQKELRAGMASGRVAETASSSRIRRDTNSNIAAGRARSPGGTGEKVAARLAKQLDRLQQLVEVQKPPPRASATASTSSSRNSISPRTSISRGASPRPSLGTSRARPLSPEGEHPPPEDNRRMYQQLSVDANEMMQQQLNEYRLTAERAREDMLAEHCEELDDLVGGFNLERRGLHDEIREMRAELATAEVAGAASRPMSEIRAHFESQVAVMKRELVAQLSDVHEREREQRGNDERDLAQLQQSLERCQRELASSQEEFALLGTLFDKERRENLTLKSSQKVLELRLEAEKFEVWREGIAAHSTAETADRAQKPAALSAIAGASSAPAPSAGSSTSPPPQVQYQQATLPSMMSEDGRSPDTTGGWDSQVLQLQAMPHNQGGFGGSAPTESPVFTPHDGSTPIVGGAIVTPPVAITAAATMMASQQRQGWAGTGADGSDPGVHTPGAIRTPGLVPPNRPNMRGASVPVASATAAASTASWGSVRVPSQTSSPYHYHQHSATPPYDVINTL